MSLLTESPTEQTTKLMYSDCSGCSQLLLVDNAIQNPSLFASSVNDKTFSVTYGWSSAKMDILALLRSRFTTIDRIAIAFSCQQGSPQPFLDNQNFFTADESFPYSDNIAFIISLIKEFKVKQIDYLGCSTLTYSLWNQYYSILKRETGITIGASNDQTGNMKYGGDWTLESTGQDIESVYFTQGIQYYQYVLDAYYTTIQLTGGGGGGFISAIVSNNFIYYKNYLINTVVSKVNATNGTIISTNFIDLYPTGGNAVGLTGFYVSTTNIFIVQGTYLVKYNLSGTGGTQIYTSSGGSIVGTDSNLYYITVDNDGLNLTRLVKLTYDGTVIYKLVLSNTANSGVGPIAIKGDYIYTWRPVEKKMYKINISGETPYIENNNFLPTVVSGDLLKIEIYNIYMYIQWGIYRIDKFNLSNGLPDSPSAIWIEFPSNNSFNNFSIDGSKLYIFRDADRYFIYQLTDYSMICFKEDSLILTDQGYRPVQDLRKGDLVRTALNGYIPIEMIGKRDIYHPATEERIKDQLYECSPANYPDVFEPLVVTGCHSILVFPFANEEQRQKTIEVNGDAYVTDHKFRLPACVDERATVYDKPGNYTIYHFALENDDYYMNYGVYANGLLVETCSKRYLTELANMELIE